MTGFHIPRILVLHRAFFGKDVNYFHKKAPSEVFDWVLDTSK